MNLSPSGFQCYLRVASEADFDFESIFDCDTYENSIKEDEKQFNFPGGKTLNRQK